MGDRRKRMHGRRRKRSPINFSMSRDLERHTEQYGEPMKRGYQLKGGGDYGGETKGSYGGGLADSDMASEYRFSGSSSFGGSNYSHSPAGAEYNRRVMEARKNYVDSVYVYKKKK